MKQLEKHDILIIVACAVLLIGFIVCLAVFPLDTKEGNVEETISETVTDPTINESAIYEDYLDSIKNTEALIITNTEIAQETTEKQAIIINELNALKAGKLETVKKYFGESDSFAPDIVADRVAPAEIHFITNPESSNVIYAHICTLDYQKILKSFVEGSEDITAGILNGDYDICYTVSISINDDNTVIITEALKEAITGGWYLSDAEPVACILG